MSFSAILSNIKKHHCIMEFKIRAYGRMELAQLYCPTVTPDSAYRKLCAWIKLYPHLSERLEELGHSPRCRSYTPAQVRAIVEALGEP